LRIDDEGFSVFELNGAIDWAESCNRARAQIFPGVALPAVDAKFEAIMAARRERAAEPPKPIAHRSSRLVAQAELAQ